MTFSTTKPLFYLIFLILVSLSFNSNAQTNKLIKLDSITRSATQIVPYNAPFTVQMQIDADNVRFIHMIKKFKHKGFEGTIQEYTKNGKSYYPTEIPKNYYRVEDISKKKNLILTIDDEYKLQPAEAYYVIIGLSKLDSSATSFFDNYYQYTKSSNKEFLNNAERDLTEINQRMKKVFGEVRWGIMSVEEFKEYTQNDTSLFNKDFKKHLLKEYTAYDSLKNSYNKHLEDILKTITLKSYPDTLKPNLDTLTYNQLIMDTTINNEALKYILGKDLINNDYISDLNSLAQSNRIEELFSGVINLSCIYCNKLNKNSNSLASLKKRISNIESSTNQINQLNKSLYLLKLKRPRGSNVLKNITILNNWLKNLQNSKTSLNNLVKQRQKIEKSMVDNFFAGYEFIYSSIISSNTYLDFETRNKVLLTPDFGIVTPAITKRGSSLEYGIVPYLGFHVNFMAVDKDLTFKSYKKNWKQHLSLMVGWLDIPVMLTPLW